jgi:hypothetical protein
MMYVGMAPLLLAALAPSGALTPVVQDRRAVGIIKE